MMTFIGPRYRTILGAVLIGLVVTVLGALWLPNQSIVVQTEWRGYDTLYYLRGGDVIPQDIVMVGVDQDSVKGLAQNRWPLPRTYMADAINFLHRAGARVIAPDFLYISPSLYGQGDTAKLVRAVRSAGNVVLENSLSSGSASNFIGSEVAVTDPLPPLHSSARAVGAANISEDADSVVRSVPVVFSGPSGERVPIFAVQVAALATHRSPESIIRDLPSAMYINYVGQQRPMSAGDVTFHLHQFQSVAQGDEDPSAFRNKIVLLIPDLVASGDLHETPVGQMYGGFLQANILNTILRHDPIVPAGDGVNRLLLILAGLAVAVAGARFGIGWSTGAAVVIAVGYLGLALFLFDHYRTWIQIISPEITIVLVYALIMAFRFSTEERQKRRLKSSFGLYLEPDVIDLMVNTSNRASVLSPSRRRISTLFVDVRGFTRMSEHARPEDIVKALDVYLEELTLSIKAEGGSINKYVGDEIIGVWNYLPVREQPDHVMRAVRAGLNMLERMDTINEQLAQMGLPPIRYGVGINTGDAVVGEMGSSQVKQYDMIGDTVNTAARLCSAAGGGEVIIGQAVWEEIGDKLVLEETDTLPLKGKSEPLRTFLVLGLRPEGEPVHAPAAIPAQ